MTHWDVRSLSDVDRQILDELDGAYGEGLVLAHDLAALVEVKPQSMGGRLASLSKRGLIEKHPVPDYAQASGWTLTEACYQAGRPWRPPAATFGHIGIADDEAGDGSEIDPALGFDGGDRTPTTTGEMCRAVEHASEVVGRWPRSKQPPGARRD